jgi:hypothetical protein
MQQAQIYYMHYKVALACALFALNAVSSISSSLVDNL